MNQGKVKFFNTEKGFGFITDNGGKDVFFHVTEIQGTQPKDGDSVEYELSEGRKGACAIQVRVTN